MKADLELKSLFFDRTAFERESGAIVKNHAQNIVARMIGLMEQSAPAGRIYTRGAITARRTKALSALGLRSKAKTRVVTGAKFHRASAPGQPPAVDSGKLKRGFRLSKVSNTAYEITNSQSYANLLDRGTGKMAARPFTERAIEMERPLFEADISNLINKSTREV